jgi:hypothetical protein
MEEPSQSSGNGGCIEYYISLDSIPLSILKNQELKQVRLG